MSNVNKIDTTIEYPEFNFKVWYFSEDSIDVEWRVWDMDENLLMTGNFYSKDFYRSRFTIVPSNIEENVYENLFYLYFENIKLKCIDIVEYREVEENN